MTPTTAPRLMANQGRPPNHHQSEKANARPTRIPRRIQLEDRGGPRRMRSDMDLPVRRSAKAKQRLRKHGRLRPMTNKSQGSEPVPRADETSGHESVDFGQHGEPNPPSRRTSIRVSRQFVTMRRSPTKSMATAPTTKARVPTTSRPAQRPALLAERRRRVPRD